MKSVLISIRPEWCEKIASGEKTVDVRKTMPKLAVPFKCYIYCTKGRGDCLWRWHGIWYDTQDPNHRPNRLDGKVIGEFVCDKIIRADCGQYCRLSQKDTQIDALDLMDYADGKTLYGWHISDLVIYDQPRGLTGFYHYCGDDPKCYGCELLYYSNTECGKEEFCCSNMYGCKHLERPPQSWCYVVEGGE